MKHLWIFFIYLWLTSGNLLHGQHVFNTVENKNMLFCCTVYKQSTVSVINTWFWLWKWLTVSHDPWDQYHLASLSSWLTHIGRISLGSNFDNIYTLLNECIWFYNKWENVPNRNLITCLLYYFMCYCTTTLWVIILGITTM